MNPENCEGTLAVPLGKALNSIQCIRDRVRDGESSDHGGAFDLSMIWESLNQTLEAMSEDMTNLNLASSKPPQTSLRDGEKLVESVLNSIQALSDVYDRLHKSQDKALEAMSQDMTNLNLASLKPPQPSLQDGEKLVESVMNSIQVLSEVYDRLHKSQDGESSDHGGAFDVSMIWESFNQALEAMSQDMTNLNLASSKPPQTSLQDGEKLVESVLNSIQALSEVYDRLHKSQDGESGEQSGSFDRSFFWESFNQGMMVGSMLLGMGSSKPPQPSLQYGEKMVESVMNSIQALSEVYDRLHKSQDQALEAMSEDVTKLSLAFSRPPQPSLQDGEKLVESVLNSIQVLSEVYDRLHKSQGVTLRRQVRDATVEVLDGVLRLVEVIISSPLQSLTQEQITSTRGVWSACDRFARLPKDNKEALLVVLSSQSGVVKDAIEEMKQILSEPEDPFKDCLINDPDDNSDHDGPPNNQCMSMSEKDQQVIRACQEIFETAAACLRKLGSAVEDNSDAAEPQKVAQLDDLADISREISTSVDDLALCLYPPMNYTGVENHTSKLAALLRKFLELIRSSHVCGEAELTWVQFLEGAVDHNVQKAKELIELDG